MWSAYVVMRSTASCTSAIDSARDLPVSRLATAASSRWRPVIPSATARTSAQRCSAGVRVDLRGTGDSDGILLDEYLPQERDDALEVIAWLAEQPWCSGAVGMIGISWGGFNGLQVAARRPPALQAVISLCSTVDRYADDVHFMGGCLLND